LYLLSGARPTTKKGPESPENFSLCGVRPSDKKIQMLKLKSSEQTDRRWLELYVDDMVGRINHIMRGWANYLRLGTVKAANAKVTAHPCFRLRRWLTRKFRLRGPQWARHSGNVLDLWAAVQRLPLFGAAIHLAQTFQFALPEAQAT
jgi:hypothetical protein